ncbi:MAG: ribosome small subunit-dependent GTPase A [Anaerovoracaceae bacterium]|nr:ribosome small subunit-dependent GTPase A [Anaerovoracaceae bacterium]
MNRVKGRIIKGIGGFYYVETPGGVVTTRGRGNLKKSGDILLVGDYVEVSILNEDETEGVVEKVLPRENSFVRPPIANVDLMTIVVSGEKPKVNVRLLDRFLCVSESKLIPSLICVNKTESSRGMKTFDMLYGIYGKIYPMCSVSGKTGKGLDDLRREISGSTVAFAGPSGVGKSTILNAILGQNHMEVGEISKKTSRGRHTTRHVELIEIKESKAENENISKTWIFDTPGFTSLDLPDMSEANLRYLFPELVKWGKECRFMDCQHIGEPECSVLKAVEMGSISQSRYNSYKMFYEELSERKKF